jgi:hypothetical protein
MRDTAVRSDAAVYSSVQRFFFSTLDPGGAKVLTSVIRPVACAGIPVRAAGFLVAGTRASGPSQPLQSHFSFCSQGAAP